MASEWILACDAGCTNFKLGVVSAKTGTFLDTPIVIPNSSIKSLDDVLVLIETFARKYTERYDGEPPQKMVFSSAHRSVHRGGKANDVSGGETILHHWGEQSPKDDLESRLGVPLVYVHDATAANAAACALAPLGRTLAITLGTYIGAGYIIDGVPIKDKFGFWELEDATGRKVEEDLPPSEIMWGATGVSVSLRYAMDKLNRSNGVNAVWPDGLESNFLSQRLLPSRGQVLELLEPLCDNPIEHLIDPSEIFQRAQKGDLDARRVLAELGDHLAWDFDQIYQRWPFDTVVLAGGLAEAHEYYGDKIKAAVEALGAQIVIAENPIAVCVSGAAAYVIARELEQTVPLVPGLS